MLHTVCILTHFHSIEYWVNTFSGFFYENMDWKTTKEAYPFHKDRYKFCFFFLDDEESSDWVNDIYFKAWWEFKWRKNGIRHKFSVEIIIFLIIWVTGTQGTIKIVSNGATQTLDLIIFSIWWTMGPVFPGLNTVNDRLMKLLMVFALIRWPWIA